MRSISRINELRTISDDNEDYVDPDEMPGRLMEDNRHLAELQRKARGM